MPSFALLGDESLEAIAAYVLHLSIRGELEFTVMNGALRQDRETLQLVTKSPEQEELIRYKRLLSTTLEWEDPEADVDDFVAKQSSPSIKAYAEKYIDRVLREYIAANKNPLPVPAYPYPENQPVPATSLTAGHTLFKAQCVNCHADYGRQSDLRFDIWGSVVRPANLTQSQYKGGRRPVDLYYRIARGIPPCAMPKANLGDTDPGRAGWDLVNFLQALPHPDQLPSDVRDQVYGPSRIKLGANP
jgi:mono/diheme cytochrome c family protein